MRYDALAAHKQDGDKELYIALVCHLRDAEHVHKPLGETPGVIDLFTRRQS